MKEKVSPVLVDPEILGGIPVFRGTRVPIKNLFDYLEGSSTLEEFLEDFPSVTREVAVVTLKAAKLGANNADA